VNIIAVQDYETLKVGVAMTDKLLAEVTVIKRKKGIPTVIEVEGQI